MEINFRGKTPEGLWVKGFYLRRKTKKYYIDDDGYMVESEDTETEHLITNDGYVIHRIIPESLGISFGNIDKNGKEIFASFEVDDKMSRGSDIFTVSGSTPKFMQLNSCRNAISVINVMDLPHSKDWDVCQYPDEKWRQKFDIEIIGNAFDNAEMLKVKNAKNI